MSKNVQHSECGLLDTTAPVAATNADHANINPAVETISFLVLTSDLSNSIGDAMVHGNSSCLQPFRKLI